MIELFFACTEGEDPRYSRSQLSLNGYPGGEGFPLVDYLTNVGDGHRRVAAYVAKAWETTLGIRMQLHVVNGGPEPVTIAQVLVDDATWTHSVDGPREVGRLQKRVITVPYPWVQGEPHVVKLVSRNGVTFEAEVAVATQTPCGFSD